MNKTIGIGVTGGIAAYKIADLVSLLKKEGFEVIVMMTKAATKFITPLTLETLSGREVITDMWEEYSDFNVPHIDVAKEIDLLVIAPATANFIAKMACGIADDFLSTLFVANIAPVLIAPAMNTKMYENAIVQNNLAKLRDYGCNIIAPATGHLACNDIGKGRLPEVEDIFNEIKQILLLKKDLKGKTVMVNAGTTCEDIDPVRFIANRSSGKMGYCIAEEAIKRGANVILVSGKTTIDPPEGAKYIPVWSADEMCEVMQKYQADCDVIVGAAAVGDFKIADVAGQKLKKADQETDKLILELVENPDILKALGQNKANKQVMVGFAAETNDIVENAKKKLETKNLDFIVANDVTQEGAGFGTDTNIVTLISRNGSIKSLPLMSKEGVAAAILDKVVDIITDL